MDTLGELSEESGSSEAEEDMPLPKAKKKKALAEPALEELEHLGCASVPVVPLSRSSLCCLQGHHHQAQAQVQERPFDTVCAGAQAGAGVV